MQGLPFDFAFKCQPKGGLSPIWGNSQLRCCLFGGPTLFAGFARKPKQKTKWGSPIRQTHLARSHWLPTQPTTPAPPKKLVSMVRRSSEDDSGEVDGLAGCRRPRAGLGKSFCDFVSAVKENPKRKPKRKHRENKWR